jgi:hypothetical protein
MITTEAQADCRGETFSRPDEQELHIPDQAEINPMMAHTLRLKASRWLSHAQQEFHDALFALDGSDDSFDRYACARAELDSAEAWALHVTKALRSG